MGYIRLDNQISNWVGLRTELSHHVAKTVTNSNKDCLGVTLEP